MLLSIVFLPTLDLDVFKSEGSEGFNEGFCQTHIGHQGDVVVDGAATNAITIGQFALGVVLGNVDNQVEFVVSNHLHDIVVAFLIGPVDGSGFHTILIEELGCAWCGIYLVTLLDELLGWFEQ